MKTILPYEEFFLKPLEVKFIIEAPPSEASWLDNYNMEYYLELKQLIDYAKEI